MRTRGGFTVIEQLVAGSIMITILSLGAQLLHPTMSAWQINRARASMEQASWVSTRRLSQELNRSTISSLSVLTQDPPAVSFLSYGDEAAADAFDPLSGNPIWRKFVIYYVDVDNQVLYRKTFEGGKVIDADSGKPTQTDALPSMQPYALSLGQLRTLCTSTNGTEVPVGAGVENLTVASIAGRTVTFGVTVRAQDLSASRYGAAEMNN